MANKTMHHLVIKDNNYEILDAKNRANIAAEYSASSTYNVGDVVLYNGQLYKCTTAITTAEAWTAAHWTAVTVGEKVADLEATTNDLKDDLQELVGFSETLTPVKINGLNVVQNGTAYANSPTQDAFYIPVEKDVTYKWSTGRSSGSPYVRMAFSEQLPANGVSFTYIGQKQITTDTPVEFSFTAPSDGYICESVYINQTNPSLMSIEGVKEGEVGNLQNRVDELESVTDGFQYDVDSICKYIEHDINELVGGWQSGFWANGTGALNPTRTDYVCSVNSVEVVPSQTIYVKNIPYAGTIYLVPYKEDGSYNSGNISVTIVNHEASFTVPANTYYVKFDIQSGGSGPNPMIPTEFADVVVSNTDYQDFSVSDSFVINRNFTKNALKVENKGNLKYMQAFCIYNDKYYSTDGSNIGIQDSDLTEISTTSINVGHGNSMQLGSGNIAYVSGWNDNKVYAVDLDNVSISDTITLPTTGYTTCVVDDVNKYVYIFQRDSVPDTEAYYNFIVYDYDNQQIKSQKKITKKMSAIQDMDFVNDTIIVNYGLGTTACPSGIVAFDTSGDEVFYYDIPQFSFELEGVAYNKAENRLEVSNISTSLYWITQK